MFGLFGWLRRRPKREIFRFFDGTHERSADPIKVLRSIAADHEFNPESHFDLAQAGDLEAQAVTIAAARRIFALAEFSDVDGRAAGTTDGEALGILSDFAEYVATLKKSTNGPPTLLSATESAPSAASTTNAPSGSGSTLDEPRPAAPLAS